MAGLILLGLLAPLALLASALPWPMKAPAAVLAAAQGGWLARREARRPALALDWAGGPTARIQAPCGVQAWADIRLVLRGPIAVLSGRGASGRRQWLAWWPDTLPASSRRQLRLAADVGRHSDKPLPPVAA